MAEYYKISGETLTAIADRTRQMAGTNKKLTPAEIIYWLGKVSFIPQGRAESSLSGLTFDSAAVGVLPTVYYGTANSTLSGLAFTSTANGELTE